MVRAGFVFLLQNLSRYSTTGVPGTLEVRKEQIQGQSDTRNFLGVVGIKRQINLYIYKSTRLFFLSGPVSLILGAFSFALFTIWGFSVPVLRGSHHFLKVVNRRTRKRLPLQPFQHDEFIEARVNFTLETNQPIEKRDNLHLWQ